MILAEKQATIRKMNKEDLATVLNWAALGGAEPGLYDLDTFFNTDPDGYFIAEIDGQPVGSYAAIAYDDTYGFLGYWIVLPDFRGQKIGFELLKRGLEYMEDRNAGFDGVDEQMETYLRWGFIPVYKNMRFAGMIQGTGSINHNVVDARTLNFDELDAYDADKFGVSRSRFLKMWINQKESTALGVVENGKIAGFGVIRPCTNGYKIGPLFADNSEIAESLFNALTVNARDSFVILDVPEPNEKGMEMARKYGLDIVMGLTRMYTKKVINLPLDEIFGSTTAELG